MARFIAVHTLPYNETEFSGWMKKASERMSELPPEVIYNHTYCDFDDHKFFCDWEAPDKKTMEQVFKSMEIPFDAIYPVKVFSRAKMDFEVTPLEKIKAV